MAREKTPDEVRDEFLDHIWHLVDYWAGAGGSNVTGETDVRSRLSGLAFSILVTLDGEAMALPGFVVAPAPHPSDRAYNEEEGEDWYPEAPAAEADIAGSLHDVFHQRDPQRDVAHRA